MSRQICITKVGDSFFVCKVKSTAPKKRANRYWTAWQELTGAKKRAAQKLVSK